MNSWKMSKKILRTMNNENFNVPSNTTTSMCLLLKRATCFGLKRTSPGYQYNVLKQVMYILCCIDSLMVCYDRNM